MTTRTTGFAFAAAASLTAFAGLAQADVTGFSIDQSEVTRGVASVMLNKDMDVEIVASVRDFRAKTVNGVTGVGIRSGNVSGEIDGTEVMTFTFDQAVVVSDLQISFLYNAGEFGDDPAESALISTDRGDMILSVTGPTTADWSGAGTAANLSIATEAGGGHWQVSGSDIFGGAITTLSLFSGNPGTGARYGDFSFVSLSATAVPTPGALALLGLGGLTAGVRARRASK